MPEITKPILLDETGKEIRDALLIISKATSVMKGEKGDPGDTGPTGPAGPAGPTGANGSTPVRGTDYWTAADKQEIVNDVLNALPTWEGGSY